MRGIVLVRYVLDVNLSLKRCTSVCHYRLGDRGMAYTRERLYVRYPFSGAGEILEGSGVGMRGDVTNISYGGCRLLTQTQLPLGASINIKIQTATDQFEAAAKVVHSTPGAAGLMFGDIAAQSLFVLRRWIDAATEEKRSGEGA